MKRIITTLGSTLVIVLLAAGCQMTKTPESAAVGAPPPSRVAAPANAYSGLGNPMFPQLAELETHHPDGSCVSQRELEADQFIRLHTLVMVVGLTCHVPYGESQLFSHYQRFTVDHQSMIRDSQRVLEGFLGRYRSGNRQRLFDTYRTRVANAESQLMIDVSAARYCSALQEKFYAASEFSPTDLQTYLDSAVVHHTPDYRLCDS